MLSRIADKSSKDKEKKEYKGSICLNSSDDMKILSLA